MPGKRGAGPDPRRVRNFFTPAQKRRRRAMLLRGARPPKRKRRRGGRITEDYLITHGEPKNLNPNPFMFMGELSKKARAERRRPPAGSRHDRSAERRRFGAGTAPTPVYKRARRKRRPYSPANPAYPSVAAKREAMRKMGKFRPGAKRVALGKRGIRRRKRKVNIFGQLGGG